MLFPEAGGKLQAFGGGRTVADEIEFRRKRRGLTQNRSASLVGRSQAEPIVLTSQKGGVGKTSPAASLALVATQAGKRRRCQAAV